MGMLDWLFGKPQQTTKKPSTPAPTFSALGAQVPYVGPYSPQAYNAAAQIAVGGSGAPYSQNVLSGANQVLGKFATGGDGGVLGQSANDGGGYSSGGRSASGGGGYAAAPSLAGTIYDPAMINDYKGKIGGQGNQLNDLYNAINASIDTYARDRRGQIDQSYTDQFQTNDKSYNNALDQNNAIYAARGAFDSSFRGNAANNYTTAYDSENKRLRTAQDQNYADLGRVVADNKAQIAERPKYDLGQYNDVNSLQSLYNQLGSHIQNLSKQKGALQTGDQLRSQLNAVAPATSNLDAQLKTKLDALTGSNASPEAKYGLAQGYIGRSGLAKNDQDKWNSYFLNLVSPKTPSA
jgi:uncharacterized protein YukE